MDRPRERASVCATSPQRARDPSHPAPPHAPPSQKAMILSQYVYKSASEDPPARRRYPSASTLARSPSPAPRAAPAPTRSLRYPRRSPDRIHRAPSDPKGGRRPKRRPRMPNQTLLQPKKTPWKSRSWTGGTQGPQLQGAPAPNRRCKRTALPPRLVVHRQKLVDVGLDHDLDATVLRLVHVRVVGGHGVELTVSASG